MLGSIAKIAPTEVLASVRFQDAQAFLSTYDIPQARDPFFVFDLPHDNAPILRSELIVPGFNSHLFFHDNRVLALGEDEFDEGLRWRFGLRLFDVSDVRSPQVLDHFMPRFADQFLRGLRGVDEQEIVLNWQKEEIIVPVRTQDWQKSRRIQLLSFTDNKISDRGQIETDSPVLRTLPWDDEKVLLIGDQMLSVSNKPQTNTTPTQPHSHIELGRDIKWLNLRENTLWAAAGPASRWGRYYRFYAYDAEKVAKHTDNAEAQLIPEKAWVLPHLYTGIVENKRYTLFYQWKPFITQVLDRETMTLFPASEPLEAVNNPFSFAVQDGTIGRGQVLLNQNTLYIAELYSAPLNSLHPLLGYIEKNTEIAQGRSVYWQPQHQSWKLRPWSFDEGILQAQKETIPVPGTPLGLSDDGVLLSYEWSRIGQYIQIYAVNIETKNATLLDYLRIENCALNKSRNISSAPEGIFQKGNKITLACINSAEIRINKRLSETRLITLEWMDGALKIATDYKLQGQFKIIAEHKNGMWLSGNTVYPSDVQIRSYEVIISAQEKQTRYESVNASGEQVSPMNVCGYYVPDKNGSSLTVKFWKEINLCNKPDYALSSEHFFYANKFDAIGVEEVGQPLQ